MLNLGCNLRHTLRMVSSVAGCSSGSWYQRAVEFCKTVLYLANDDSTESDTLRSGLARSISGVTPAELAGPHAR